MLVAYLAPPWMLALWLAFATTFRSSLAWLIAKPQWCALFGALGGPIAYVAGAKLGAISIPNYSLALPIIGLAWSIALATLSMMALRWMQPRSLQTEPAA
jgi:hypothetical protein